LISVLNPLRPAHAIVETVEPTNSPYHFLLGTAAADFAMAKLDVLRKEFIAWEAISRAADFPKET
jgi:hypothetical protein